MAPTFNGIGLAVADMATSLAFYRKLGLDFPASSEAEPHVEALLPGGSRLMLDTLASLSELGVDVAPQPGGPSLAFLCQDPAEVDAVFADLAAAGFTATKEPWDAPWGQRYALVADPDGHQVDLFAWVKEPG